MANYVDYDNAVALFTEVGNKRKASESMQESLLKSTVGWTGKNLLCNKLGDTANHGVTYKLNTDGSVTINGTADSTSVYCFNRSDNNINMYTDIFIKQGTTVIASTGVQDTDRNLLVRYTDGTWGGNIGNDVPFTCLKDVGIVYMQVLSGASVDNITIYPMLRDASITDDTYEPYHESVEVMYEEEIHGVNLLNPFNVANSTNVVSSVGSDGTVNIKDVSTAMWSSTYLYHVRLEAGKRYTFSVNNFVYGRIGISVSPMNIPSGSTPIPALTDFYPTNMNPPEIVNKYVFQTSFSVTSDVDIYLWYCTDSGIGSHAAFAMKPMLRLAAIEDPTYRPYNYQAIQNQLNAQGVLGAKNLLPNTATSQTINGVTFTVNADKSVTVNGTATADAKFNISKQNENIVFDSPVIFSGSPSQSANDTVYMRVDRYNGNTYVDGISCYGGNEVLLSDITKNYCDFRITVLNGKTVSNLTFKPMLRLASDPDDTYQPYAMTNRELTDAASLIIPNRMLSGYYKDWYSGSHDLNDLGVGEVATISGSNASNISHMPTGVSSACGAYTISVYGNYLRQFLILRDTPAMYTRTRSQEGTWTNWYSFTMSIIS